MQTLVSVMEEGDALVYIDRLNIKTNTVVIDQCDRINEYAVKKDIKEGKITVNVTESTDRGLSKSRNLALTKATDDICIFCDNDIRYEDDAKDIVTAAFERYPEAGVICFFIERPERQAPIKDKEGIMSKKDMMRIFSPEIAVRRSGLGDLRFDEDFGAGARYSMGEENIFLFEAKRRGIECIYVPVKIAKTIPNESSWFKGYGSGFFFDRGAGYEAMDKAIWYPLAWQFLLRKRGLYLKDISMLNAYKAMCDGRRDYKKLREQAAK
ncbi:MAG: glycosyltransferase family 2 protein [Lachnospiraceae bacterium]|nr:glycosyltransferase family 2 protein [Lachnospiraceae bacterium]